MSVPTYDQFIEPVLRYLAHHPEGAQAPAVHDAAAVALQLTEDDRAVLLPSGKSRMYKNRAGWAHDRLKRAGLSTTPKHGFWRASAEGVEFAKAHPGPFAPELVEKLATGYIGVALKPSSIASVPTGMPTSGAGMPLTAVNTSMPSLVASRATPDDQLEQAVVSLTAAANDELRERLATVSPTFFEEVVLDVLHAIGYGAKRDDLIRVGAPHDAGIDGVISLDRLGLEKVYVQAKRWGSVVGRPELQAFYGALAGQKAKKGVFITTSSYTPQAKEFAKSVEGIVLLDGVQLAALMIDCEIGISSRTVRVPKIDSDYFDEDA